MEEELNFKFLSEYELNYLESFFNYSKNLCSENSLPYHLIWANGMNTKCAIYEDTLYLLFNLNSEYICLLPLCPKNKLIERVELIKKYFHNVLKQKFKMMAIDEESFNFLNIDKTKYNIIENENSFDYLYNYSDLTTLKGKKYQNKRNLINNFIKEYQNRFEYKILLKNDYDNLLEFEDRWLENKDENDFLLIAEKEGLINLLNYIDKLNNVLISGIYIDNKLEAFEVFSYHKNNNLIIEHIEKANKNFKGLYTAIMHFTLKNNFNDALYVNREEDMGIKAIKEAKRQLHPIKLIKKYIISEI